MGDVISTHLDEAKRETITRRTDEVIANFGTHYEQQYAVALFNNVRFDIEGGGGPQPQLLHRKVPLKNKAIFSGALFQYVEESKKWRKHFIFIPNSYGISSYESKAAYEKGQQPKGTIDCAGYRVLTSMDQYLELLGSSLPGVKAKVSSSPFLKCATQFPLILWHPFARHYYFCVMTENEQLKWSAVFQDCVRHSNNGLSEESKVQTPAFTDAVRLYRQAQGHYGTWDMMCGDPAQILANLVMEKLTPELRELIAPRLKGKMHEKQRSWMLISDAVYSLVQSQAQAQYKALVQRCEAGRPQLEASIRTDMDQIITAKEHVTGKIRALVFPKAEKLLKVSIQPYISSILEALMEPTSRGFFEVRDVFFKELVDMSKNLLNEGNKEKLGEHMEKISMLAFHPVKMQSCYEKVEQLSLEGLQQRFDVSSPSVFVQRAQILMREQTDDAVYTFEQLLHQSLEGQEGEELNKIIQRCQDRVIKKFDYDSSTVRKRFFREALLQIFIPYMLKQLSPSCLPELPKFQELIFEDFSRFILVETIFEEVVLQTVMKDIMMAVKEAAVQRKHNLYRDSIVLTNSDPNLLLLGENPSIDWAEEYGGKGEDEDPEEEDQADGDPEVQKRRRMKQVVSMIQLDGGSPVPESCLEVPGVEDIPEVNEADDYTQSSPDVVTKIPNGTSCSEANIEASLAASSQAAPSLTNGSLLKETDVQKDKFTAPTEKISVEPEEHSPTDSESSKAIERAIQEIENAVQEEDLENESSEASPTSQEPEAVPSEEEPSPPTKEEDSLEMNQEEATPQSASDSLSKQEQPTANSNSGNHDDSGFQSPTGDVTEGGRPKAGAEHAKESDSETGEKDSGMGGVIEPPIVAS
ncbi:protein Niban 2b [Denticeps clupeoides]|uniref:PH domain-containing protein n=1 Tax=Denticeps clupeoides TaxID=299321 RepID=A0AAY4B9P3_9TELE|nr:niban-like protein 1 [Denticeps clupeoides]